MGCGFSGPRNGRGKNRHGPEGVIQGMAVFKTLEQRVLEEFHASDKNGDGQLDMQEIKQLLFKLNAHFSEQSFNSMFNKVDLDKNGTLTLDEFRVFFSAVQSLPDLKEEFDYYAKTDKNHNLMTLNELFEFCNRTGTLKSSGLPLNLSILKHLAYEFEECVNPAECEESPNELHSATSSSFLRELDPNVPYLSLLGFQRLVSDGNHNSFIDSTHTGTVYQNMTLPLSCYWISASHNTYLSGNQLSSASSCEAIAHALRLGVRVIELDTYDDPKLDCPIVNHGGTLCSPITFEDAIITIRDFGFQASEYPVILTIENHCTVPFQEKQVEILDRILGKSLFRWNGLKSTRYREKSSSFHTAIDGLNSTGSNLQASESLLKEKLKKEDEEPQPDEELDIRTGPDEWLSPAALKKRVIIRDKPVRKNKKSLAHHTQPSSGALNQIKTQRNPTSPKPVKAQEGSEQEEKEIELKAPILLLNQQADLSSSPLKKQELVKKSSGTHLDSAINEFLHDENDVEDDEEGDFDISGVALNLLKIIYIRNIKLGHKKIVNDSYLEPPFRSSSSLAEKQMMKLTKPGVHAKRLSKYASNHLVRTYPAGVRIDSSNYDPFPALSCGCQIVALNYQTYSIPTWSVQGFFHENGGCGYILKPDYLRTLSVNGEWNLTNLDIHGILGVTVISGHYLPKPFERSDDSEIIDPFVSVSLFGIPDDYGSYTTKVVDNNGFNPVWKHEMRFPIRCRDLATILFVVKDRGILGKETFIAQQSICVKSIQPGFRVVPLRHANFTQMKDAFLFCKFEWVTGAKILNKF